MESLPSTELRNAKDLGYLNAMAKGWRPENLAKRLAPRNKKKQKRIVARCYALLGADPEFFQYQAMQAQGRIVQDLPAAAAALMRRAKTGRPDAIKLAFEASGMWSPRQQHDHTGEIKITLQGVPRPERVEDITDAEVVE